MRLLYYLFVEHNILPSSYRNLPAGEKVIVRAFFEKDMESRVD